MSREVGSRSRPGGESRREQASRRVQELLGSSSSREGIDARSRDGPNRSGVDARDSSVDESAASNVSGGPDTSRSARAKRALLSASESGKAAAKSQASKQAASVREKATRENLVSALKATASSLDGDVGGSGKSRNQEIVERAERSAHLSSPMSTSLATTGDPSLVSEMAAAPAGEADTLLGGAPMDVDASSLDFGGGEEESEFPSVGMGGDLLGVGMGSEESMESEESGESGAFDFDDPFGVGGGR